MADGSGEQPAQLRWELAGEPAAQQALFEQPVFEREPGRGEYRGLEFLHVRARRIINEIKGPRRFLPFQYTINAYRGCSHACAYCFARPTHTYLNLGPGDDFDSKIVVKVNAVARLRAELDPRRWAGDPIAMGTNTDPYQRCEGKYRLTQGIIGVLAEHANPFSILTKSTLVLRDLDLLVEAARRTSVRVSFSIGTLDEDVWRATEPGTPHPRQRLKAVAALVDAGIDTGVLMAPVLPGLSDSPTQLRRLMAAVADAGAVAAGPMLLHLRPGVKEVFMERLADSHPELVADYERRYADGAYGTKADRQRLNTVVAGIRRRAPARRHPAAGNLDPTSHLEAPVAPPSRRPRHPRQLGLL